MRLVNRLIQSSFLVVAMVATVPAAAQLSESTGAVQDVQPLGNGNWTFRIAGAVCTQPIQIIMSMPIKAAFR